MINVIITSPNQPRVYVCVQLKVYCTLERTKKIVVGFAVVSLTVTTVNFLLLYMAKTHVLNIICAIIFHGVMPVTVLVINSIVVRQV